METVNNSSICIEQKKTAYILGFKEMAHPQVPSSGTVDLGTEAEDAVSSAWPGRTAGGVWSMVHRTVR